MRLFRTSSFARRAILRDLSPLRPHAGAGIDEWYSDGFLRRQAGLAGYVTGDLAGSVLEVVAPGSASRGLAERLLAPVGDVTRIELSDGSFGQGSPRRFDAVVLPLSLQYAESLPAAARAALDLVLPGGVVLATLPGIGPLAHGSARWPERWHVTALGARRVFESASPSATVTVQSFGNVLTATAHLYQLPANALSRGERELHDPDFPVVVAVRVVIPAL